MEENSQVDTPELFRDIFPYYAPPRMTYDGFDSNKNKIYLTDTTLRDGQQGWRTLTVEESLEIYDVLHKISGKDGIIRTTELFPYTQKDREVIDKIVSRGYTFPKPIGWIRAREEDLNLILQTELKQTVLLCSISDYHIYYKLGLDRKKAIEKYLSVISKALSKGISLKVSLEDITRTDVESVAIPFVRKVQDLSEEYSTPVIFKLADTLGVGLPFSEVPLPRGIPRLVKTIIQKTPIEGKNLEFHGHNDFHLVVANHTAAWVNGVVYSNCTLFGVGERAGNCPLEAMLIVYHELMDSNLNVDLTPIKDAANLFRKLGFNISDYYPLVGNNAFQTKAGIHIDGILKNPEVYLPFDSEKILGIKPKVEINSYSGKAGVVYWLLNNFNINHDHIKSDKRIDLIYSEITKMFENGRKNPITDAEMLNLVKSYMPEILKCIKNES
ncbi:MAG: 2-isopropylmalate synthase [Thermoproteota archaeon]|nr:2-isopropylmalate synthase [Candidatus Brockarchaeota archaeon]